jgi:hypothetical protein
MAAMHFAQTELLAPKVLWQLSDVLKVSVPIGSSQAAHG